MDLRSLVDIFDILISFGSIGLPGDCEPTAAPTGRTSAPDSGLRKMRSPSDAKSPRPVSRRGPKIHDVEHMQVICPTCQSLATDRMLDVNKRFNQIAKALTD
jgi:hypothetical protein